MKRWATRFRSLFRRRNVGGRPPLDEKVVELIVTLKRENPAWGCRRIREELRRMGIRVSFRDQGPGISDVDRVLVGGFSTARSLGLGLSGTRRLVDEFSLDSGPGRGTRVVIVKWTRF